MSNSQRKAHSPKEIDDIEDRMGSMEQLDFSERKDERRGRVGDTRPAEEVEAEYPARRVREAGLSGGETLAEGQNEDGVSLDDLSPETLIDESGARSPRERGGNRPLDKSLTVVGENDIGGGDGLDEAELAKHAPLDGKPWRRDEES